jgi:hypothetical protein
LLATPAALAAPFLYTLQNRSVTAHTHGPAGDPSQFLSASDFALFDKTASVTDALGAGFANQHQKSTLLPDAISVVGDFAGVQPAFAGTGTATGNAHADITFTISASTDVTLSVTGGVTDPNGTAGNRQVSLTGPGTNISLPMALPLIFGAGAVNKSQQATLGPGTYELLVDLFSAHGFGSNISQVNSFDVELTVPEPASVAISVMAIAGAASALGRRRRVR